MNLPRIDDPSDGSGWLCLAPLARAVHAAQFVHDTAAVCIPMPYLCSFGHEEASSAVDMANGHPFMRKSTADTLLHRYSSSTYLSMMKSIIYIFISDC